MEYVTCKEAAKRTGMPEEVFRAGCHRSSGFHPLPHIKSGSKRPVIRIEWEDLQTWLREESRYQIGA